MVLVGTGFGPGLPVLRVPVPGLPVLGLLVPGKVPWLLALDAGLRVWPAVVCGRSVVRSSGTATASAATTEPAATSALVRRREARRCGGPPGGAVRGAG